MRAPRTWIVVANGARARIARHDGPRSGLRPAMNFEFAAPHAPTRAFVSDRPGSYPDRGALGFHRLAPRTDRRDYERTLFASDLARVIAKAASHKEFDRLVLVAPPDALGRLRAALNRRARALIAAEVSKDLTHVPIHALSAHLADVLGPRSPAGGERFEKQG